MISTPLTAPLTAAILTETLRCELGRCGVFCEPLETGPGEEWAAALREGAQGAVSATLHGPAGLACKLACRAVVEALEGRDGHGLALRSIEAAYLSAAPRGLTPEGLASMRQTARQRGDEILKIAQARQSS